MHISESRAYCVFLTLTSPAVISGGVGRSDAILLPTQSAAARLDCSAPFWSSKMLMDVTIPLSADCWQ